MSSFEVKFVSEHRKRVNCLSFSPCGSLLASGGDDGKIAIYSTEDGKLEDLLQQVLNGAVVSVLWVKPLTKGSLNMISGSADGSISLWTELGDIPDGTTSNRRFTFVWNMSAIPGQIESLAFSDSLRTLVVVGAVFLKVYQYEEPDEATELLQHEFFHTVMSAIFCDRGSTLILGFQESHEILVIDARKWTVINRSTIRSRVGFLSWSDRRRFLAVANLEERDGIDVYEGHSPPKWKYKVLRKDRRTTIKHMSFFHQEQYLASGGDGGVVYIIRTSDGKIVQKLHTVGSDLQAISVHPGQYTMIAAGESSSSARVVVWHNVKSRHRRSCWRRIADWLNEALDLPREPQPLNPQEAAVLLVFFIIILSVYFRTDMSNAVKQHYHLG